MWWPCDRCTSGFSQHPIVGSTQLFFPIHDDDFDDNPEIYDYVDYDDYHDPIHDYYDDDYDYDDNPGTASTKVYDIALAWPPQDVLNFSGQEPLVISDFGSTA